MALALTAMTASAQWNTTNEPLLVSGTHMPYDGASRSCRTADGKTFIAFCDMSWSGFQYYMQALDKEGNLCFTDNGIEVNGHASPSWRSDFDVVPTTDNCVVLTCADSRSEELPDSTSGYDFVPAIYKLDIDQNFLWGLDGITMPYQTYMPLTGAFPVGDDIWFACVGDSSVYNRVKPDGTLAFAQNKSFWGQIVPCEGTDFIAVYNGSDGASAMRYNENLEPQWGEPAVLSSYTCNGYYLHPFSVAADGHGGVYVSFTRYMGTFSHMVTVNHVTAEGDVTFGLESVDVYATEELDHDYCAIGAGNDHALVLWAYKAGGGVYNLQAQLFDESGERMFGDTGMAIASHEDMAGYAFHPVGIKAMANGDWLICYAEELGWGQDDLYVERRTQDGKLIWKQQIADRCGFDDANFMVDEDAAYITWGIDTYDDDWNSISHIYAERIFTDGSFDGSAVAAGVEADPANNSTLESIDDITLTLTDHSAATINFTCEDNITVTNEAGETVATLAPDDDYTNIAYGSGINQVVLKLSEAITTEGKYTVSVPKGMFSYSDNGWQYSKLDAFTLNYTVSKTAAINAVENKMNTASAGIYTIDGKKVAEPQRGLNIVKAADGTTQKFIRK